MNDGKRPLNQQKVNVCKDRRAYSSPLAFVAEPGKLQISSFCEFEIELNHVRTSLGN